MTTLCSLAAASPMGLLFHGVKFEKDCTRTSSLVISNLDDTCRFTNTVHIKEGAQSIALS